MVTYYEPHTYQLTCKVRTMVAGRVFWDHMTYDPYCLPPIKALSIADMLGADESMSFWDVKQSIPYVAISLWFHHHTLGQEIPKSECHHL